MKQVIIGLCIITSIILTGCAKESSPAETLAKCLNESGAVFYGTERCSHCKDQKAMFGTAMQYINYVDCDFEMPKCNAAKIEGYPTWILKNGTRLAGTQELSELAELNGCSYK